MKIHEYQAKQLMAQRGISVPLGKVASTVDEAVAAVGPLVSDSGNPVVVVKSQIHAGGRGKGRFREHPDLGGVNVVTDGIAGGVAAADTLYIEQGIDIANELYLSVLLDRAQSRLIVMASTEGGMEIEKVAEETPELILKETIDPAIGLAAFQSARLALGLGLAPDATKNFKRFVSALTDAAVDWDADLIEINPLVVTTDGAVMALDGKMAFDDNALFRHPDIAAMRDESEEDPAELEAKESGLSYITLDGTIGCLVNGAGLAMATMDTIKHVGGEPANFLDVGGGANAEQVAKAFRIITADPNVKGIFVNIFGGIMQCDVIATGIVEAVKEVGLEVPLVVRLEGTNVELGRQIIDESDVDVITAVDMKDGAQKIVELAS